MTYTLTHTSKRPESLGKHRRAVFICLPMLFDVVLPFTCAMNLPIFSIACSCIWRVDESNVDGFAGEVFFIFDAVLNSCFSRKWRAIYPRRVGVVTGVNFDELAAAFGTDRDSAGVIGVDMAAVCFFYAADGIRAF